MNGIKKAKTVLITGASRGLGQATALAMAERGYHVWIAVRDPEGAASIASQIHTDGGAATVIALDVTDPTAIAHVAARIHAQHGHLDALVNNAGIMLDGAWLGNTVLTVDAQTLQRTFETNFYGAVAVAQAMWPLLCKAGHANVVNVSSRMGSNTLHADPEGPMKGAKPFAYDASKAALNTLTTHLAEVGAPDGIQVNSAHPGWVRTDLGTEQAMLSVQEGVQTIIELATLPAGSRTGRFEYQGSPLPW